MDELIERLRRAAAELEVLRNQAAASHALTEHARLAGKIEGVNLALGYAVEMEQRGD